MHLLLVAVRRRLPYLFSTSTAPDPFATLELQHRLSRLSSELHRLNWDTSKEFAVGHHARAAMLAYEHTLADACRLMGLDISDAHGPTNRLLAEASLFKAGWSW